MRISSMQKNEIEKIKGISDSIDWKNKIRNEVEDLTPIKIEPELKEEDHEIDIN